MRRVLAVWMALSGIVQAGLISQQHPLPAHPRDLRFASAGGSLPSVDGRRFELESGPVVYLAEDHTLPLIEISLALRVGAFLDPPGTEGLAYLAGSLLRRAGTSAMTAEQFDDRVDELGALLESLSGLTRGGASLSVPSWSFDEALDLYFGMISSPRFQHDRLHTARTNLIESMQGRNENAVQVLQREWQWLMLGERIFSTRPMTPDSLNGIESRDLRVFHRQHWRPESMILAVSGDFEPHTMLSALEDRFSRWPELPAAADSPHWPPVGLPTAAAPGLYHYEADVPQAKVMLGQRLPALLDWQHGDRFSLVVLAEVLGGRGAISRIAGRLRTKEGLVYRASATLDPGELWPGEWRIFFETRSSTVGQALRIALEEVERMRSSPVHAEELAVARQALLARLRLSFDTAEKIAGTFAEDELLGRPHEYWRSYVDGLDRVTTADLMQAARRYLDPARIVYLVVGRWPEIVGEDRSQQSLVEQVAGHTVSHLPARDPLTLQPLPQSAAEAPPVGR